MDVYISIHETLLNIYFCTCEIDNLGSDTNCYDSTNLIVQAPNLLYLDRRTLTIHLEKHVEVIKYYQ